MYFTALINRLVKIVQPCEVGRGRAMSCTIFVWIPRTVDPRPASTPDVEISSESERKFDEHPEIFLKEHYSQMGCTAIVALLVGGETEPRIANTLASAFVPYAPAARIRLKVAVGLTTCVCTRYEK